VAAIAAAGTWFAAAPARAQDTAEEGRFFADDKADPERTAIDGSFTSSTFLYQETGGQVDSILGNDTLTRSASPVGRLFTDLRLQLDVHHISGGKVDVHVDARGRVATTHTNPDNIGGVKYPLGSPIPTQAGRLGDEELELRELYVRRRGKEYDVYVGRKYSLELAAVKYDGLEIQRKVSKKWTYLGFAGLYPTRGSRDVRDDYPKVSSDPSNPDAGPKRLLPITGGLGGAYRTLRAYGALGAVAIFPLARDQSGRIETPRVFATANGYWRRSERLDLFHYLVLDAMGAAGAGLTNLTLGLGFQPRQSIRLSLQGTRVDTETLNVQVINELEDPAPADNALRNNVAVRRSAQESVRGGLSVAIKQSRFEISTHGTLRRRPELSIPTASGDDAVTFPTAKAVDVYLGLVDRRSWKDLRIGLSGTKSFPLGSSLDRTETLAIRLDARKEVAQGKGEIEGNLGYTRAVDEQRGSICVPNNLVETCYGATKATHLGLGGLGSYRLGRRWFVVGSVDLGRLSQTGTYGTTNVSIPAITTATLFARIAYRF
jgi:hypothetical protein